MLFIRNISVALQKDGLVKIYLRLLRETDANDFRYTPNITDLSNAIDTNRNNTVKYLSLLANAKLLNLLSYKNKTIGDLTKPDKVLLNNTNLSYIFGDNTNIGSGRKTFAQIKDVPNSFVVAGDIEIGHKNKIPLWLFGMMY